MNTGPRRIVRRLPRRAAVAALAAFGLLIAGLLRLSGAPQAPSFVLLGTLLLGGAPLVAATVQGILRRRLAADIVAALAIIGALVLGEYFAGTIIVLMQSGGEMLESIAMRRAAQSLEALLDRAPRIARRRTSDGIADVPVAEIAPGDIIVLRPGDLVPVDAVVIEGRSHVDQSALTGEPAPVPAGDGTELSSGTVNLEGALAARALRHAVDSQYQQIVALVEQARRDKAPVQRLADRWAVWFTPLTLAMCLVAWLVDRDPVSVLAVLVVATPCPMILATPVAIVAGMGRAARRGIIVRGGAAIEAVGRVSTVVFDKTGTLTEGHPSVTAVMPEPGFGEVEILRLAGAAEVLSSHHVGQAIAREAARRAGALPPSAGFHEQAGSGVEASVDGRRVTVGAWRWVRNGARGPGVNGANAAHVMIDGRYAGRIEIDDRVRPEAAALTRSLEAQGIHRLIMLTGDHHAAGSRVARATGIAEVHADLLPADKVRVIGDLRRWHDGVLMVGDGINDAPALAAASVGIAMGAHAPAAAAQAADIVLLVDDISRVGEAVAIGRRTRRIAIQGMGAGVAASVALMIVAAFGHIAPAAGALLQEALDVAVIVNALRAR